MLTQPTPIKLNCPECDEPVTLDKNNEGTCPKCNLNVGAVYERARHERALKKMLEPPPAPAPAPQPENDGRNDPFSFGMPRRKK